MANITDPSAVKFSNEQIRIVADKFMQLYWLAKQLNADWTAKGLAPLFPNNTSVVMDGSAIDGRTPITGAGAHTLLSHANTFIADLEASNNLKRNQIEKIAVNER